MAIVLYSIREWVHLTPSGLGSWSFTEDGRVCTMGARGFSRALISLMLHASYVFTRGFAARCRPSAGPDIARKCAAREPLVASQGIVYETRGKSYYCCLSLSGDSRNRSFPFSDHLYEIVIQISLKIFLSQTL